MKYYINNNINNINNNKINIQFNNCLGSTYLTKLCISLSHLLEHTFCNKSFAINVLMYL